MSAEPKIAVGSEAIVRRRGGRSIVMVVRETKTQWIVSGGDRFSKRSMRRVGDADWNPTTIEGATPNQIEEMRASIRESNTRRKFIKIIETTRWSDASTDVLRAVVGMLSKDADA